MLCQTAGKKLVFPIEVLKKESGIHHKQLIKKNIRSNIYRSTPLYKKLEKHIHDHFDNDLRILELR